LVEFFGGKKELLIIGIVLFLKLSCVSMSNFNVLHSKLLINSKIIFLSYYELEVESYLQVVTNIGRPMEWWLRIN